MYFYDALKLLMDGKCIYRRSWNGLGQYITIQKPSESNKMTLPYIYISTVQGFFVPWGPSQTDILGCDWEIK